MNAPLLDAKINSYKQKLHKLDSLAERLSGEQKRHYTAARKRFEQRLEAWQQTLGSDLAVFDNNVSEGYHELESQLLVGRKTS